MASVNEDLLSKAISNELRVAAFSDALSAEIRRVLEKEVLPDIARRLRDLPYNTLKSDDFRLVQLRAEILNAMQFDKIKDPVLAAMGELATEQVKKAAADLDAVLPFKLDAILPAPDVLIATVLEKPFNGRTLGEWFDQLSVKVQDDIYKAFRIGMVEGKSIREMSKDLLEENYDAFASGTVKQAINGAIATVKTAANYISTQARISFAEQNSDIIKGVVYTATLDDRTTAVCMSLHGSFYPLDDMGPIPPQHYGCRSALTYVTKSFAEMGIDAPEIPKLQAFRPEGASRMDGTIPQPKTFDAWLKTQSKARQDRLLGPVRAQLWRDGKIPEISGFVATDGETASLIPLKDLGFTLSGKEIA